MRTDRAREIEATIGRIEGHIRELETGLQLFEELGEDLRRLRLEVSSLSDDRVDQGPAERNQPAVVVEDTPRLGSGRRGRRLLDFTVGARVGVTNSIKNRTGTTLTKREYQGTVTSVGTFYVSILTDSGKVLRRAPHNLELY